MLNFERMANEAKLNSRLILQVHDELIFEVAQGEEEVLTKIVREAMGSAAKLSLPLDVNIGIGRSWAEAAH
jgi:DNA polymerase-1